jgi:hypothetical protein
VGMVTTWNTQCGIGEYSSNLARAMRRRDDVDLKIFGSVNEGERAVREYAAGETPVFRVQAWDPAASYEFDIETVLAADLDVLHIQYSNLFYKRKRLIELMRRFEGVVALTYHDKIVPRNTFPHGFPDLLYAHREDVGIGGRRYIPQGIDVRPPVVKTFGLGKSRDDLIAELCERNGWRLETSFGERRWLEHEELYQWLRDCDAIVLWYDEDLTSGGSAAAPLAIATRRPVFVNDTEWFRDLPHRTATLRKVADLEELEREMRDVLEDPYAAERSWDTVADTHVTDYREALAARAEGARRRMPLRARGFAAMDDKPLIRIKRRWTDRKGARS